MVQGRTGTGGVVPLMVRVPEALRDRIKAAAEASGRSQNSEIVAALEEAYPANLFDFSGFLGALSKALHSTEDPIEVNRIVEDANRELERSESDWRVEAFRGDTGVNIRLVNVGALF